jgi:non-heme chloroperoxidase
LDATTTGRQSNSTRLTPNRLLKNGTLKTYPGFSHGMLTVNAEVLNADLLAFVKK